MSRPQKTSVWMLLSLLLTCSVQAQTSVTLRSGDEPSADNKKWERGAALAYASVDGKSTTDIDMLVKLQYELLQPLTSDPAAAGSIKWKAGLGPYLHKHRADEKPQNDRGAQASLTAHWKPGGDPSGPVVNIDMGISFSAGKKLTETTAGSNQYLDVDTQRAQATLAGYVRPHESMYFRTTVGAYDDRVTDSPKVALNGREAGWSAKLQWSFYPTGLLPLKLKDELTVVPLLTLSAQKQWDSLATGSRREKNYKLYSIVLSFPFRTGDAGLIPSFDIERSIGADLLQGRPSSGKTSALFTLKY